LEELEGLLDGEEVNVLFVMMEEADGEGCFSGCFTILLRASEACSWISMGTGRDDTWKLPFLRGIDFVENEIGRSSFT